MLGAHSNPHLCHDYTSLYATLVCRLSAKPLWVVIHLIEVVIANLVLSLEWMKTYGGVVWIENSMHIFMALEINSN